MWGIAIDWMAVAYALAMIFGAMIHWWRQYLWDPANTGTFIHYWIGGSSMDKSASGCTLLVLVGAILVSLANGVHSTLSPYLVISGAILAGYSVDSFFNKGLPPAQAPIEAVPKP